MGPEHIGKEAHNWEQQFALGSDAEMQSHYGMSGRAARQWREAVAEACKPFGVRELAREAGLAPSAVSNFLRGTGRTSAVTLVRLAAAVPRLDAARAEEATRAGELLARLRELCDRDGVIHVAGRAGIDPANLRSILSGRRKLPKAIARRLEGILALDSG